VDNDLFQWLVVIELAVLIVLLAWRAIDAHNWYDRRNRIDTTTPRR
jgi:hypothetical protein